MKKLNFKLMVLGAVLCMGFAGFAHAGYDIDTLNLEQGVDNGDVTVATPSELDGNAYIHVYDTSNKTPMVTSVPDITGADGFILICGDATTVNNNTVYYGPNITFTSATLNIGGLNCDIDAAGNATEATADAPAFGSAGFYALGMTIRTETADLSADLTYAFRAGAAATSPSVACTVYEETSDCVVTTPSEALIPANTALDVGVSSTADVGANAGFIAVIPIKFAE